MKENEEVSFFLCVTFFVFLAIVLVLTTVRNIINLPTVYEAWPEQECVKVVPKEAGSCDELPRRYHHVWISRGN